jgi:hypothetical protein
MTFLVLGIPTELVPNPVFARKIEAPLWTYPSLLITAVLAGLLLATYVRDTPQRGIEVRDIPRVGPGPGGRVTDEVTPDDARSLTFGGLLSFFAIGCPTCNKLVLIALGSSGAITWFEPVQPVLAVAGIGLLAWALRRRLRSAAACVLPAAAGDRALTRD